MAQKSAQLWQRVVSMLLALLMVLAFIPAGWELSVGAAGEGTMVYLSPNANWKVDNARFAAYYFQDGKTAGWVSLSDSDGDGYYEGTIPEGYTNVIFCRMNPSTTTNNWNNKWNQTGDLTLPTDGKNCYTVAEGAWDEGNGTWSTYTPAAAAYTLTLHFNNTKNWSAVYGYAWYGSPEVHPLGDWSGSAAAANANNSGWYDLKIQNVPASGLNFLVHSNSSTQTADLSSGALTADTELWITPSTESNGEWSCSVVSAAPTGWSNGSTTEPAVEYYLFGWINGADYADKDDYANMGTYKFVDGKLRVNFTQDSYVGVKTTNNGTWYMTDGWRGNVTSATLYDSSKLSSADKLLIPKGTCDLTLTKNADGTLTLSYEKLNYYLVGYLNNADYTGNDYLFTNGSLTTSFTQDSYVYVKDSKGANYMASAYCQDSTVTLATGKNEKMLVPKNTRLTFTLTENTDGTLTLSYQKAQDTVNYDLVIHFYNSWNWSPVTAYAWTDAGTMLGAWPGTATTANASHTGWYDIGLNSVPESGFNFIFNDNKADGAQQTIDLFTGTLTGVKELWVYPTGDSDGKMTCSVTDKENWDGKAVITRNVYLPGTFPGPSWNASSNQMTYDQTTGLYSVTFENVAAGRYEYKVAINGNWGENYGANGAKDGANIVAIVPAAQKVTVWYNDTTHLTQTSLTYDPALKVVLSGTGIADDTELTDPGLTGVFTVTVDLSAGTHDDLKLTVGSTEIPFGTFTTANAKKVTFYYDSSTGLAYHNGSDTPMDTNGIYFDSKDSSYKSPYGAVKQDEQVTYTIRTNTAVTGVSLIRPGMAAAKMEKKGEAADGYQYWTVTASYPQIGEYDYYFAITDGSALVYYGDDNYNAYFKTGDYGTGRVYDPTKNESPMAYDQTVYVADFETPDWLKNAVIYQIFPDRFYNGDMTNDQAQTSARGNVDYEYVTNWSLLPSNPRVNSQMTSLDETYIFKGDSNWSNEIYGGDLEGITAKIDYLDKLGVTVIYLNPVFSSISNHRYDACDYMEIDPILGDLGDFTELVEAAEAKGMKIVLDGVFNHVSDDSVYFDRYYKFLGKSEKVGAYPYWAYVYDYMAENNVEQVAAETAARAYFQQNYNITDFSYTEWFQVNNTPLLDENQKAVQDSIGLRAGKKVYGYEGWWGYDSMPVILSTNGSEYQTGNWAEEIIGKPDDNDTSSVTEYWITQGNNGWRLDVANEVSDETWQNFRKSVKALDSEAVIIGEIWADASYYLRGDMYDSVMNYIFRDAVAGFARGYLINRDDKTQKWDSDYTAADATTTLEILRERYPAEAFYAMMNLVGSHDTARILSYLDDVEDDSYNQTTLKSAYPSYKDTSEAAKQLQYTVSFLQFTYAGAPTIYYGDEIGMVGADDPDDRRTFEWNVLEGTGAEDLERQTLLAWYTKLADVREDYAALRTGSVEAFAPDTDVMGYVRRDASDELIVLANRDYKNGAEVTLDLDALNIAYDAQKAAAGLLCLEDVLTGKRFAIVEGSARAVNGGYVSAVTIPAASGLTDAQETSGMILIVKDLTPAPTQAPSDSGAAPAATAVPTVASNNPQTSDSSEPALWVGCMILSAGVLVCLVLLKKRRRSR